MEVREEIKLHRRLGTRGDANSSTRRPILLTVASKLVRDRILDKTNLLKAARRGFSKIFVIKRTSTPVSGRNGRGFMTQKEQKRSGLRTRGVSYAWTFEKRSCTEMRP